MKKISFVVFGLIFCICSQLNAQWSPNPSNTNTDITRFGVTGFGFPSGALAGSSANGRSLMIVDGTANNNSNIMAHWLSGNVGDFNSIWAGIGLGNPGNVPGVPNPYGLSIVKTGNLAF